MMKDSCLSLRGDLKLNSMQSFDANDGNAAAGTTISPD
jgi:hypothetical protein